MSPLVSLKVLWRAYVPRLCGVVKGEYAVTVSKLEREMFDPSKPPKQVQVFTLTDAPIHGVAVGTLSGIVMDDVNAQLEGEWITSSVRQPFVGAHYLHDGNNSKGRKSVTFTVPLSEPGDYEVRLAYSQDGNRAKNVPITIRHRDGTTCVQVDQTAVPPIDKLFISLGTFAFDKEAVITVATAGTTGHVIVDAVQLLKK